eukprot:4709381-Pyramimonas_sp.AAC.1
MGAWRVDRLRKVDDVIILVGVVRQQLVTIILCTPAASVAVVAATSIIKVELVCPIALGLGVLEVEILVAKVAVAVLCDDPVPERVLDVRA